MIINLMVPARTKEPIVTHMPTSTSKGLPVFVH